MGPRPLEPGVGEAPTGRIQNGGRRADPKRRPPFGSETGAAEEAPKEADPKRGPSSEQERGPQTKYPDSWGTSIAGCKVDPKKRSQNERHRADPKRGPPIEASRSNMLGE